MKYVDMNEVVYDQAFVAFPGLGNCHGVVYVTKAGVFGYHAAGDPGNIKGKVDQFGLFVKYHVQGGSEGLCLYGLCPTNRHTSDHDHKTELKLIADAIGFDGKFMAYRWDLAPGGTTYVEAHFNQSAVTILTADFSDGTRFEGRNTNKTNHKYVAQRRTAPGPLGFSSDCTSRDEVTTDVMVQARKEFVTAKKI